MSVGANIKKRRYEMRMSQQELADALGYKTRSTIAKIESGENDVSHKKLQKFATVLDTTVEELIMGYTSPKSITFESAAISQKRNKNIVIILAGGKSGRNKQNIPSQFVNVNGKPIIVYCMEAYQNHPLIDDIYIVCLKGWENIVTAYAEQYEITKLKALVPNGISGIQSLQNALENIKNAYSLNDIVVVQEATRPMVTGEMISRLLKECNEKGSATIGHLMDDYVQFQISENGAKYINRDSVVAMQSPEAHRLSVISGVFAKAKREGHPLSESCCTMLMHNLGYEINFIESSINNIKIVREEDFATFGALVNSL
ncbi:MAG: XRE family transcriptional regulator [Ruminococcaceae bacterium]|nr:XRE family transcriptional regulator [Oscillospiraceae bacterium]